jgi:hypothetical protein
VSSSRSSGWRAPSRATSSASCSRRHDDAGRRAPRSRARGSRAARPARTRSRARHPGERGRRGRGRRCPPPPRRSSAALPTCPLFRASSARLIASSPPIRRSGASREPLGEVARLAAEQAHDVVGREEHGRIGGAWDGPTQRLAAVLRVATKARLLLCTLPMASTCSFLRSFRVGPRAPIARQSASTASGRAP